MAAYCLQGHGEWLLNPYKQNVQFKGSIPVGIRILYLTEAAYCLYTTFKMFTTPLKRDIYQMLAHHLVTLVLLGVSYYCTQLKYGICITLLHNLTTPIMDAAKLCNYFHLHKCANVIFMIFATLFFYLRVWIFPSQIIHAI